MKTIKIIFKIIFYVLCVLLILVALLMTMIHFSDPNKYKSIFIAQFEEVTQQKIILTGPLEFKLLPLPHVKMNEATIQLNLPEGPISIYAKNFEFGFNYWIFFVNNKKFSSVKGNNILIDLKNKQNSEKYPLDSFIGSVIISPCDVSIPNFNLKSGKNDLSGNLLVSVAGKAPMLTGFFNSQYFNISSKEKLDTLFKGREVNGIIDLKVNQLDLDGTRLNDAKIKLDFNKKEVTVNSKEKNQIKWPMLKTN